MISHACIGIGTGGGGGGGGGGHGPHFFMFHVSC